VIAANSELLAWRAGERVPVDVRPAETFNAFALPSNIVEFPGSRTVLVIDDGSGLGRSDPLHSHPSTVGWVFGLALSD
jgi:hypothetical protein